MEREPKITQEYKPGQVIDFGIESVFPDGSERYVSKELTIEKVESGGFFGKVLFFKDQPFVIKTPDTDPSHNLLRVMNWDREFPHFSSRNEAVAEHIATRLLHNIILYVSDGKFSVPDSIGFCKLPNGHYAQVVERIEQRPAKLDRGEDRLFRSAQEELTALAINLGFEHVGQIHHRNPYGMSNVRIDVNTGKLVWLDTVPAIPHKERLWPIPPLPNGLGKFKFHREIRDTLNDGEVTFNRVHTDVLIDFLSKNSGLFPPDVLEDIKRDIGLYNRVWEEKLKEPEISNSEEVKKAWITFGKSVGLGILKFIPDKLNFFRRLATDPKFIDEVLLSGLNEAKKINLVTKEEYDSAIDEFEKDAKKRKAFETLYKYHLGSAWFINAMEAITLTVIAPLLQDKSLAEAVIPASEFVAYTSKPLLSLWVWARTGVDFKVATAMSLVPFAGGYLAVPTEIAFSEKKASLIHHYKLRELIAHASKLHPAGGWGSQPEAELYNKVMVFTEAFTKFWKDQEGKGLKLSDNSTSL